MLKNIYIIEIAVTNATVAIITATVATSNVTII